MQPVQIGVGLAAFASTNIDDIFVLIGFFSQPDVSPWQVVLGQYAGLGLVILSSLVGSLLLEGIPHHLIGVLGVVPILLGTYRLYTRRQPSVEEQSVLPVARGHGIRNALAVAAVTISNGSDNVATYIPLFASSSGAGRRQLTVLFLVLIGVWCALGYLMVSNRIWGNVVRKYGALLLPYVLIILGCLIFARVF